MAMVSIQMGMTRKGNGWHLLSPTTTSDKLTKRGTKRLGSRPAAPWKACGLHCIGRLFSYIETRRQSFGVIRCATESSDVSKQLSSLDSYFGKLSNKRVEPNADFTDKRPELVSISGQSRLKKGLRSINDYLGKVNQDANSEQNLPPSLVQTIEAMPEKPLSTPEYAQTDFEEQAKNIVEFDDVSITDQYDETSDLYLICLLASINIAVFLFEIATPIRNSELLTLPSIYGAKINALILVGEWWRLVTPMFLHFGLLHVALGCWSLLTFAPQVCKSYGLFAFVLIYILGGVSGNFASFLHTPEPTVGGTGPIFAIIGAWLVYQHQNKHVIDKDLSDRMFQKAVLITVFSFLLSTFGPIDEWAHFGAIFTGILYGYLTCPAIQLDDGSSKSTGQGKGVVFVGGNVNPWRSVLVFAVLILLLSSSLYFIEPPLDTIT